MTEIKWSCFACDFVVTKKRNGLTNFKRSLGLARHNHLRKHNLNTAILEGDSSHWNKKSIYHRDERLRRIIKNE